jgi:hypothetical protein
VQRELQTAYGFFLGALAPWDYWVTLTFTEDVHETSALRALKKWMHVIAKEMVRAHVPFAWVMEPQQRGTWHFHVLLAFPDSFQDFHPRRADALWKALHPRAGFTKFDLYDPVQGATFYIAKTGEPDFNVACPRRPKCRRARGCVEAPGAW